MVSQFENNNQLITGYDFAPQWLSIPESTQDAQKLLVDFCAHYNIHQASVLAGYYEDDFTRWEVLLSSSGNNSLSDILPLESLTKILDKDLLYHSVLTLSQSDSSVDGSRQLVFIVAESQLLDKTVFIFDRRNEISFEFLATLRLISDILFKIFTDNEIIIASDKSNAQKLSKSEFELLRLRSVGQNDEEMAATLNLSTHAVHYLLKRIMKKLGSSNSLSAIAKVSRFGG